jgi:hypothetical protein
LTKILKKWITQTSLFQDKDDIAWAVQNGVDFISATIGTPKEVIELKNLPTLKNSKVKVIIKLDREYTKFIFFSLYFWKMMKKWKVNTYIEFWNI